MYSAHLHSLLVSTRLLYTQRCQQTVSLEMFVTALMTDNTIDLISLTADAVLSCYTNLYQRM
jgi:hypothetical protein